MVIQGHYKIRLPRQCLDVHWRGRPTNTLGGLIKLNKKFKNKLIFNRLDFEEICWHWSQLKWSPNHCYLSAKNWTFKNAKMQRICVWSWNQAKNCWWHSKMKKSWTNGQSKFDFHILNIIRVILLAIVAINWGRRCAIWKLKMSSKNWPILIVF